MAYDELLSNQIALQLVRQTMKRARGRALKGTGALLERLRAALPFQLTGSQEQAIEEGLRWLRLGEMIHFHLRRPPRENALAVPYQALYGGNRLYLLEDGRMRGVDVERVGETRTADGRDHALLRSSAITGEVEVVVTQLPNALDGLRVRVAGRSE